MKKKFLATVVFTFVLVLGLGCIAVSAASYEKPIKNLIDHLANAEFEAIDRMDLDYDEITLGSSNRWKAEVAAISIPFSEEDVVDEIESYYTTRIFGIEQSAYDKECLNIFGKKVSLSNLQFGTRDHIMEAAETNDYGYIVSSEESTPNKGMKDISLSIKKSGKKYIATKKIFYGYWEDAEAATEGNYQLTYTFKKSSKSEYGYILTKLNIKQI